MRGICSKEWKRNERHIVVVKINKICDSTRTQLAGIVSKSESDQGALVYKYEDEYDPVGRKREEGISRK